MSTSLIETVYPLMGKLRSEFNVFEILEDIRRYGNAVRIGQTDWCLGVKIVNSERTGNEKHLGVYLTCLHKFGADESVQVEDTYRLVNQSMTGSDCKELTYESNHNNNNSWGITKFIKWSSLMNDGYVKNGKIILECEVNILSEKISRNKINFEQPRPNNEDLKNMLSTTDYQMKQKWIEREIELSQISKNNTFTDTIYIDGIPCKVNIRKEQHGSEDWLSLYLYYNSDDGSKWWRIEAKPAFRIKNRNETGKDFTQETNPYLAQNENPSWGDDKRIRWSELIDPKNGYVKYGRVIIEVLARILNKYGFDENTGKGIAKPMTKMTDAVISVGEKQFHVSKMILSHQSVWFCNLFSENPNKNVFVLFDVDEDLFKKFLQLAHNIKVDIYEYEIRELLELLDKYKADECFRRCDDLMMDMNKSDTMKFGKLIGRYPLPKMKARNFSNFAQQVSSFRQNPQSEGRSSNGSSASYITEALASRGQMDNFFGGPDLRNVRKDFLSIFSNESIDSKISVPLSSEYSNPADLIVLIIKDGKKFHSSKQILAHASRYFMTRFFGPDAKDDDNKIVFDDICPQDFTLLLNHIYHPTKSVTEKNIKILLPLAHRFSVMDLLEKCEKYLIQTNDLSMNERENYAKNYNLTYLASACTNHTNKKNQFFCQYHIHSFIFENRQSDLFI